MPFNFFGKIKLAGVIVGLMIGTATLVTMYPQRLWIAHRGYVDDVVAEHVSPILPTINELTRWRIEDSVSKLDSEIANWQIKLPTETDPQTIRMMQGRISEITNQKNELSKKAKSLGR